MKIVRVGSERASGKLRLVTSRPEIALLHFRRWQLRPALYLGGTELPAVRGTQSHFAGDSRFLGQRLRVCR